MFAIERTGGLTHGNCQEQGSQNEDGRNHRRTWKQFDGDPRTHGVIVSRPGGYVEARLIPAKTIDRRRRGHDNENGSWTAIRGQVTRAGRMGMTEFERKVEEASVRINRSVANIAQTLEKETAELVTYLNDEVVPAVRTHSSKALRTAAGKLSTFADYLETQRKGS